MAEHKVTAEQAAALVREANERHGGFAAEVTALGVCVGAIESLPQINRRRVIDHLREMFEGVSSVVLLTAIMEDALQMKRERDDALASLKNPDSPALSGPRD